jgi:hypothetical protein
LPPARGLRYIVMAAESGAVMTPLRVQRRETDVMRILSEIVDVLAYVAIKLKDWAVAFIGLVGDLASRGYGRFSEASTVEKLIVINAVPAFLAVVLPVAKYYIFESYFYINNPLAVYLIGIVLIMCGSIFFGGKVRFLVRALINVYYIIWVVYLPLAGELTKAQPHTITPWYSLNIIVPAAYIVLSAYSYFINNE